MTLKETLCLRLQTQRWMSVADYMEYCLTDPAQGYYTTRVPFGADGDFITAPDISQMFGEIIGAWLACAWQQAGSHPATLLELGGGRGTLMRDVLRATSHVPAFHAHSAVRMIETSPVLARMQLETLAQAHPRISMHSALLPLPPRPLYAVANEFFDALPVCQIVYAGGAWYEWGVVEESGVLHMALSTTPCEGPADAQALPTAQEGDVLERCPAAETIMTQLCNHIASYGGALIFADYGYADAAYGSTLQAVKEHRRVDVCAYPGTSDLTAHVHFGALMRIARAHHCAAQLTTQGEFLEQHGIYVRLKTLSDGQEDKEKNKLIQDVERLVSPQHMGALFKVMTVVA